MEKTRDLNLPERMSRIEEENRARAAAIAKEMQNGRTEHFTELYELTRQMVFFNLRQYDIPDRDIEDAAQNVYTKVYTGISSVKDPMKVYGWIRQIARNEAVDYTKKAYNKYENLIRSDDREFSESGELIFSNERVKAKTEEALTAPVPIPEDILDNAETQRLMGDIICGLPQKQYRLVVEYYYNEQTTKQIAEATGYSESDIRVSLMRARNTIKEKVEWLAAEKGTKLYIVPEDDKGTGLATLICFIIARQIKNIIPPPGADLRIPLNSMKAAGKSPAKTPPDAKKSSPDSGTKPEPEVKPEPKSRTKTKTRVESKSGTEPKTRAESKTRLAPETQPEPKAKPETKTTSAPQAKPEPKADPTPGSKSSAPSAQGAEPGRPVPGRTSGSMGTAGPAGGNPAGSTGAGQPLAGKIVGGAGKATKGMIGGAAKAAWFGGIHVKTVAIILTIIIGGGGAAAGIAIHQNPNRQPEKTIEKELIEEIREVSGFDYPATDTFTLNVLKPDGVMPALNGMSTEIPEKSFFMGIKAVDLDEDGEDELLAAVLLGEDRLDNHFEEDCILIQAYEFDGSSYQLSDEITYAENLYYWTNCQLDVFVDAVDHPVVGLMYNGTCYGFSDGTEYNLQAYSYDGHQFVPSQKSLNLPYQGGILTDNSINAYANKDAPTSGYSEDAARSVYQVCQYLRKFNDISQEAAERMLGRLNSGSPGSVISETTVTIIREFEEQTGVSVGAVVEVTDGEPEETTSEEAFDEVLEMETNGGTTGADLDYTSIYGSKLDELQGVLQNGFTKYNGYELYDLNNDGVKELLVYESGSEYANAMQSLTVFSYDGNGVIEWGQVPSHSGGYWLLGESIIASGTGPRGLTVFQYTYQNGEFVSELIYGPDDGYGPGLGGVPELQEAVELSFWTQDLSDRTKLMEA